jgi:ethanolamine utilization protein EutQ (cupin superfamily)
LLNNNKYFILIKKEYKRFVSFLPTLWYYLLGKFENPSRTHWWVSQSHPQHITVAVLTHLITLLIKSKRSYGCKMTRKPLKLVKRPSHRRTKSSISSTSARGSTIKPPTISCQDMWTCHQDHVMPHVILY